MYDTVSIAVAPLIETGVPLLAFALNAGIAWLVAATMLALGQARRVNQQTQSLTPAFRME